MRRTTALTFALGLVALFASLPAAGTSLEDERTAALLAAVAADDPTAPLVGPAPITPTSVEEIELDALAPSPSLNTPSNLFRGDILYDLDARTFAIPPASAAPFDGIDAFAEGPVIGLNEADVGDVRVSN